MYWTDGNSNGQVNRIQSANLDGSDIDVVVSGVGFPWGIAVTPDASPIPEPSTFITGVSIPINSQNDLCHPVNDVAGSIFQFVIRKTSYSDVNGRLKTGHLWALQNRTVVL